MRKKDTEVNAAMENPNNRMVAAGRLEGMPAFSHEVMHESFYAGTLLIKRLSGATDRIPVTIPGKLLPPEEDPSDRLMLFQGQVRSYNKVVDGAGRLMVTLFVQSMYPTSENETLNRVALTGALCKPPVYRSTPFGREICDMMLAVNRAVGKSRNAQYAARFHVGDQLRLTGRLQSREYQKLMENGEYVTRSAYEVSAFTLEATDATPDFSAQPVDARLEFERLRMQRAAQAEPAEAREG